MISKIINDLRVATLNTLGNVNIGGGLVINASTASATKDTGALIIANGGLGVEGAINAGTTINATGIIGSNGGFTLSKSILANSYDYALLIENPTNATNNNQRYSPFIRFRGRGWKTDATAGSQTIDFRIGVIPTQGTANPTVALFIGCDVNGAGYTDRLTIGSSGNVSTSGQFIGALSQDATSTITGSIRAVGGIAAQSTIYSAGSFRNVKSISANTYGDGLILENSVGNATLNNQRYSPSIIFQGSNWDNLINQSYTSRFRITYVPYQTSATGEGAGKLIFATDNQLSGTYTDKFSFNGSTGVFECGDITCGAVNGWLLGAKITVGGQTLNTGGYVSVVISGVSYKLALVN